MKGFCLAAALWALVFSAAGIAADDGDKEEPHTVVEAESENERKMTLDFAGEKIARANKEALLCFDPAGKVTEVILWMPDHDHGTTPVKLVVAENGCVTIKKINFIMAGKWELRVTFDDGDKGVFTFEVEK